MSQAKDTITSKLKQILPHLCEFLTKEEVISLVEEAYKPVGKTLEQWLTEAGMPTPIIQKAIAHSRVNETFMHLYPSLEKAVLNMRDWGHTTEGVPFWCKVNKGIIP